MQRTNQAIALNRLAHPRPVPVGGTPLNLGSRGDRFAEVAHDARNMVTALACYCDLLEEPGVLSEPYRHYGDELKLVVAASRRLIDKLLALDGNATAATGDRTLNGQRRSESPALMAKHQDQVTPKLIDDFAWEVQVQRNMLATLAGPSITVTVDAAGGSLPVQMNCEDLTRILVNLVKNSAEAMPAGGRIRLTTREIPAAPGETAYVLLNVEDSGPGLPLTSLERIFEPGYTTRSCETWNPGHHGLGLSITRSLVERAGGRIRAANRDPLGACFQIELPARVA